MIIRSTIPDDQTAIWNIIGPTIRAGETYALDRDLDRDAALAYWIGPDRETFVVTDGDTIVATYYIRANQSGGGKHVCNCGYMTDPAAAGRGIARKMFEHSMENARATGFLAMQFNFVISTNTRAVELWKSLEFDVVGQLPGAFSHPTAGFVDALIMYRTL